MFGLALFVGTMSHAEGILTDKSDYVVVLGNALARSQHTPWTFCRKSAWGSGGEVRNGFYFAIFIILVHIFMVLWTTTGKTTISGTGPPLPQ